MDHSFTQTYSRSPLTDMSTATNRRRKWHPAIVAAVITGTAAILAAVLNAVISNSGQPTIPGSPDASPGENITTTNTPAERRAHFMAPFRGSTVEGDVT